MSIVDSVRTIFRSGQSLEGDFDGPGFDDLDGDTYGMTAEESPEEKARRRRFNKRKKSKIEAWQAQYNEAKNDRVGHEFVWDWCIRSLCGQQDVIGDPRKRTLRVDNRVFNGQSARFIFDKLTPIYRQMSSRLAVEVPAISVMPATDSEDNIIKAKVNEAICTFYWFAQDLKAKLEEAIRYAVTTGTAGLHCYYDTEAKCVKSRVVSPKDVFWPKNVKRWEDSPWWAVRSVVHRDDMVDMYPDKAKVIEKAVAVDGTDYPPDHIEFFDVYWRDGLYCVMLDGEAIFETEYNKRALPIQIIRYTQIVDIVHGIGLIEKLLPYQLLYNRKRNRIVKTIDLMGNPKILIPKNSEVNQQLLTGDSGLVVPYNPISGKPEYLLGANLPSDVYADLNRLDVEIEDVAGLHATSMGKVARGVRSARHVEALSAHDDTQLLMTQASIENAVARHFEAVLCIMQDNYDEEKMVRMFDDYAGYVHMNFTGTDVVDDPEIFLEAGSLFKSTTQDREARVLDLVMAGVIDQAQAAETLHLKTKDKTGLDKTQAMSHAREMLAGIIESIGEYQIELYPTDDLEAFEMVFRKYMQSKSYRELPLQGEEGVIVSEAIANAYKQILAMSNPEMMGQGQPQEEEEAAGPQVQRPDAPGFSGDDMGGGNMDLPPQGMEEGAPPPPIPNMGVM